MKLLTLYRRNACVHYKHTICSWAAIFVFLATVLTIILPFYIAVHLFHDIWSQYKIIYEHPDVKFLYKYIFVAEHIPHGTENSNPMDSVVTRCTSYNYLNELFDDSLECSVIKVSEKDSDFDQRTDRIAMQLQFNTPQGYALNNFNLLLEFYTLLNKQCHLQVPAALLLQQFQIPSDFTGGEINLDTKLELVQRTGFHCPFFLRHIKTHFYHTILSENSTKVRDFELSQIRRKLHNNPAYITNEQAPVVYWKRKPSNNVVLNVHITIDEQMGRYNMSYWQRVGQIWIHYVALLLIFAWCMDKLKSYMFSRQLIRAWEIIPWKKIY